MRAIPCPARASYQSLRLPRQGRTAPRTAAVAPSGLAATALHQYEARRRANFARPSSRHRPAVGGERLEVSETGGSFNLRLLPNQRRVLIARRQTPPLPPRALRPPTASSARRF